MNTTVYWTLFSMSVLVMMLCSIAAQEPFGPLVSRRIPATRSDARALLEGWLDELEAIGATAARMQVVAGSCATSLHPDNCDERCAIAFKRLHPAGANARQSLLLAHDSWKQPMIDAGDALSRWTSACVDGYVPPEHGHHAWHLSKTTDLAAEAETAVKHACAALKIETPPGAVVPTVRFSPQSSTKVLNDGVSC